MEERFEFLKKNRGFTLTELIVVIAVSAVLLSVSVAGIVAWVHHADFVRNENYAETIYYAAQSELTRYRANGQLKELEEIVRKENTDIAGKVPQEAGAEIGAEYADRLYYMKKDQGTADINTPLGGLLADYIYDGSIMEGAVCIEFDPVDGTVYSVSYSDRNERLVYKAPEETDRKEASLISRSKEIRKKERMGYYSVELSEAAPGAVGKTRLEHVELVNEEQLYLRWSLPEKYSAIRGFLSYTIEIYDKNSGDNKPEYTFVIKGNKLREADASLRIKDADGNIVPEYLVECTGKNGADEDIRHEFIAYNSGEEMYLLLDSIDYGADPGMITKDTTVVLTDVFRTDAFKNSASILQLFSEL